MSQKFSYPCPSCKNPLAIEISQAGQSVQCSCGADVVIPAMREIRKLTPADDPIAIDHPTTGKPNSPSSWSLRHGLQTACLLGCLASLGMSAWLWSNQPAALTVLNNKQQAVEGIANLTPTGAFHVWLEYYSNLEESGFQVYQSPVQKAHSGEIAQQTFMQKTFLLIGIGLAGIYAALFAIGTGPSRSPTK